MTPREIQEFISIILKQSLAGQEIESPKIDCKSIWYDLQTEKGKAEFIKDTSSIANTVGPDGFIIIGFNVKDQQFHPVSFKDAGLRDTTDLYHIINKHVDQAFDFSLHTIAFEAHTLNVLHIPPSLHKPHVIREHRTFKGNDPVKSERHRTLVRKVSGTQEATKYDLEMMFYDRKNIIPEYEVHAYLDLESLTMRMTDAPVLAAAHIRAMECTVGITFENTGRRPVCFKGVGFTLKIFEDGSLFQCITISPLVKPRALGAFILSSQELSHDIWTFEFSDWLNNDRVTVQKLIDNFLYNRKNLIVAEMQVLTTHDRMLYPRSSQFLSQA